ncbi:hypothetical protein K7432_016882 [Basidiobolus ranarum]|uniref:BZIP domain-containing protein n=1 Tax=Basidiobolus ranarum TaxID=34480 RepID=A0ABR2WE46_9FUNG
MITKPLPTPIHTLMEQFANGKNNTANDAHEFAQVFPTDYLSNSDNDAEHVHNGHYDNSNISDTHNSVSEDEFLMNYSFGSNVPTQPTFTHDMIAQAPPYAFDSRLASNKFDWGNFHDGQMPMNSMPMLVHNTPDATSQRRSSLPGNGETTDFPAITDLNPSRRRVFSWADMNHSNYFDSDMDFSQSVRRSSVSIPLQNMRNQAYLDTYTAKDSDHLTVSQPSPSRNSFPLDDDLSNSPSFPSEDAFKNKPKNKKFRGTDGSTPVKKGINGHNEGEEPEVQTVVERRLNRRRERNRLAARRSREKRTQFLHDLEGLNDSLRSENNALKGKLCEVLRELEVLRSGVVGVTAESDSSRR